MPEVILSNPEDTDSLQLSVDPPGACVPRITVGNFPNLITTDLVPGSTPGTFMPLDVATLFDDDAEPPLTYRIGCANADGNLVPILFRERAQFSVAFRLFDLSLIHI